mmetsp:Transcript_127355/g.302548  ORF Transcript_127355/g.302548 Transcript_127355/m.302548 type:complete len:203 (+) Transcript_127355:1094-1702(+)
MSSPSSPGLSGAGSPKCTMTSTAKGADSSTETTPLRRCFKSSSLPSSCSCTRGSSPSAAVGAGGSMNPTSNSYSTTWPASSTASAESRPKYGLSLSPRERLPARVIRVVSIASLATAPNLAQAGPNLFFMKPRQKMSRTSASFSSGASLAFRSSSWRLYSSCCSGEASSSGGGRNGKGSSPFRWRVAAHLSGSTETISMTVS